MPSARCGLWRGPRGPVQVSLVALALALFFPVACTDRPTEVTPDTEQPSTSTSTTTGEGWRDNFTGTDGTLLENHVPDGGSVSFRWIKTFGGTAFRDPAVIKGNAVGQEPSGFWRYITDAVAADSVTLEVEVLGDVSAIPIQYDVGIVLKNTDPGNGGFGGYTIFWSMYGSDGIGWADAFITVDRPDGNMIYEENVQVPTVGTHTFSASVSESGVIKVYVDGVLTATGTDPSPLRSGNAGLNFGRNSASSPSLVRITSFSAYGSDEVRIRPVSGSMKLKPSTNIAVSTLDLKVGVYDAQGSPVPNRTVDLSLTATQLTAGHTHEGSKPAGTLLVDGLPVNSVPTGESGEVVVRYVAPHPSGPVSIRGVSAGAKDAQDLIQVRVDGLQLLPPGATYNLVSNPGQHGDPYYGTPEFIQSLQALADLFYAKYPQQYLGFNDMSLELGGLYDYKSTWAPPHAEHRLGTNVDLKTIDRTQAQLNFIRSRWLWFTRQTARYAINDETDTGQPHFHLRY
jgi:hypothetical protein